jgi:hypothetical protein
MSSVLGSFGSSTSTPSLGSMYPNTFQNSQNYQTDVGNNQANLATLQNTAAPAAANNYAVASNNPFAAAFQTGAGTAGNAYTNAGNSAITAGQNTGNQGNQLSGYASQIMNMGLDPNNLLYNQGYSQATNAANANNAANGITGPWAAGTTNQAQQGFNTNWQASQLQNALNALSGGANAQTQAAGLQTTGNNLQTSGAGDIYTGTGLPYNTAQGISQNQNVDLNNLISNLGGINSIDSNTMSSLLQYLSQGGSYANTTANNAMQNQSNLGSGLGTLAGIASSFFPKE